MVCIHLADGRARLANGVLGRDDVFFRQFHCRAVVDQQRPEGEALHYALVDVFLPLARVICAARQGDERAVVHDEQLVARGSLVAIEHAVADDQTVLVLVVVVIAVDSQNGVVALGNGAGGLRVALGVFLSGERGLQLRGIVHIDVGNKEAQTRAVERIAPLIDGDLNGFALVGRRILNGSGVRFGRRKRADRQTERQHQRRPADVFFHNR